MFSFLYCAQDYYRIRCNGWRLGLGDYHHLISNLTTILPAVNGELFIAFSDQQGCLRRLNWMRLCIRSALKARSKLGTAYPVPPTGQDRRWGLASATWCPPADWCRYSWRPRPRPGPPLVWASSPCDCQPGRQHCTGPSGDRQFTETPTPVSTHLHLV